MKFDHIFKMRFFSGIIFCFFIWLPTNLLAQMPSKFSIALQYKDQLKLSIKQVDTLIISNDYLKKLKVKPNADTIKFINYQLISTLNANQYQAYLILLRTVRSSYWANFNWARLKSLHLTDNLDSIKTKIELSNYELQKMLLAESISDAKDKMKIDSVKARIAAMRPAVLQKMDVINSSLSFSEKNWQALKKFDLVRNIDSVGLKTELYDYEFKLISSDLTPNDPKKNVLASPERKASIVRPAILHQLDIYNSALFWMTKNWKAIKAFSLDNSLDSSIIKKQIFEYEVKKSLAWEKATFGKSVDEVYSMRNRVLVNRPSILLKLDAFNLAKKNLEMLLKYGLIKDSAEDKVLRELREYQLKWVIVNEQFSIAMSKENALSKMNLEENRPQILKDLDHVIDLVNKSEKF